MPQQSMVDCHPQMKQLISNNLFTLKVKPLTLGYAKTTINFTNKYNVKCFHIYPECFSLNIIFLTIMPIGRKTRRLKCAVFDILVIPSQEKMLLFHFCYRGEPYI